MFMRTRQLESPRPPRWPRGWIGLVIFSALFIAHTVMLGSTGQLSGTLVKSLPIVPRATRCWFWPRIDIYRTGGAYHFVHWYDEASDQPWFASAEFVESASLAAWFYWAPQRDGLWATTRREWDTRWPHVWTEPDIQPVVRRLAHAWMLAEYAEHNDPITPDRAEWLRRFAAGPARTVDIVWAGYLHNAVALALAAMSFRALIHALAIARSALNKRRALARHQCPRCRYDIQNLPTNICPECGALLHRSTATNPTPPPTPN